jgi:hypothetical protein
MRLIVLDATASLCLLAGCNRGGANNSATANAPAANAAAPAANAAAPAAPAANRDNEIAECNADMGRNLPAGSDVAGFCNCAVDRIAGGTRQNEAMEQCAAQLHITMPTGDGPEGGAAAGNSGE